MRRKNFTEKVIASTITALLLIVPFLSRGQALTGAKTIPGDYASIQAAIADLNTNGVGAGGVVFNIAAGLTETAPVGGDSITASGTAANPIVFQKDPGTVGANPLITAQVGTGTVDGIFFIMGGSYITINGIDLQENVANASNTTRMEWGYAFVKRNNTAPFIGCQRDTIKNCNITLNRLNTASRGIYVNNHTKYNTTALTITASSDAHNSNGFVNNTIQNVNSGIYISSYTSAPAPYTLWDQYNYVSGNTILDYEGASTGYGIYMYYQSYNTISNNVTDNYNNGTAGAVGSSSTLYGIYNQGTTSGANPANPTIVGNTIKLTVASGGSGTTYGMYNYYAGGANIVNNNTFKLATLGTAAATGTTYISYNYPSSYATTLQYKNNHFDSCSFNNSASSFYVHYVYGTGTSTTVPTDISNNSINYITRNLSGSGSFYGYYCYGSNVYTSPGTVMNFYNNTVDSFNNTTGTGSLYPIYDVAGGYTTNMYNNSVTRIYGLSSGTIYGMYPYYYATNFNMYNNTVSGIYGAGTIYGVYYYGYYFADSKVYNNTISNLTTTGSGSSLVGFYTIYAGTNTHNFYKNKIYALLNTGTGSSSANGTYIAQSSYQAVAKMPVKIYNNLISDIQAPNSTNSSPCIAGINLSYSSYNYAAYVSYNTINLAGNGGAVSNSSCVYVSNATPSLSLNNNILVNKTTHTGTGIASAYQRISASLATYDYTANNNLFYAGTPSSKNLYYFDGINKDSVFATYKLRMSPRELASAAENVTFISTSPASPNYLQPDSIIATVIESGGQNIAGITDDFNGKVRKGNAGYTGNPAASGTDLGAYEGDYTPLLMAYDSSNTDQLLLPVLKGKTNQVVIRMRVVTENSYAALSVTKFKMNTAGTTNIADISNAKVFYTGGIASFSAATQFGSTVAAPNGTFYVTGSATLSPGTSYFWLTYDISATATSNNLVDARFDSVMVSGVNRAPIDGDPAGGSQIATPLSGPYTIGAGTYTTLASIITDLNTKGISSSVTVNVPAGFVEQAPMKGYLLGSTLLNSNLNVSRTLKFVKDGAGVNPLLYANTGESTTIDGIFTIIGSDYVTIDGIDLIDTNAVSVTTQMERGYSLVKLNNVAPFDGCQYDSIINSTITLKRSNANSRGIYVVNVVYDDPSATALTITAPSDANSYNVVMGNTVQNTSSAIAFGGFVATTTPTLYDQYNRVIGNTVIDFNGGGGTGYGVYMMNQLNNTIANNTVDNYNGGNNGAVAAPSTLYGIFNSFTNTSSANNSNINASNNFVKLTQAGGISATLYDLYIYYSHGNVVVNNNTLKYATAGTTVATGSYYALYVYPSGYAISGTTQQVKNNHIDSIVINNSTGTFYAYYIYGGAYTNEVSGNTFTNFSRLGGTSGTLYGLYDYYHPLYSTPGVVNNIFNNTIDSINNGPTNTGTVYLTYLSGGYSVNIYNNIINKVYAPKAGTLYNYIYYYATEMKVYNNTITNITGGTTTYPLYLYGLYWQNSYFNNNKIDSITSGVSGGTIYGIYDYYGGTVSMNIYKNTITNMSVPTGSGIVGGIYLGGAYSGAPANFPINVYNNLIGNLSVPNGTGSPSVMGIRYDYPNGYNYLGTSAFNTINLSGSLGLNGSSATIYIANATPSVRLQNNILINNTTVSGTGIASVIQRLNTSTYPTYSSVSNNNIMYAGVPGLNNVINYDGTNKDQTITAYKSRVTPAEGSSITENTAFINASVPSSPNYLQPDSVIATAIESGAMALSFTTDDYTGKTRQGNPGYSGTGSAPDIGAYEGNYVANDVLVPLITLTQLGNTASTGDRTVIATISDYTGVPSTSLAPVLYFKKYATGSLNPVTGTRISGTAKSGTWSFTISSSTLGGVSLGDSVYYFIVAQDSSANNNLGSLPAGVIATDVNTVTTPPVNQYAYKIVTPLSGTITVGTTGMYPSLTNPGGAFEAINTSALSGNVTLVVVSDLLESGNETLKKWSENGTGNYQVKIVPDAAVERQIIDTSVNSVANSAVITFDGAQRATIDGRFNGSGRYLRLRNRGANGIAILFKNDAIHDTVQYCYLECVTTVTATVVWGGSNVVGGRGNDSNVVTYNSMGDTLGAVAPAGASNTGFYSSGTSGMENDANIVSNNNIYNFGYNAVNMTGGGTGNYWTFYGNNVYQTVNRSTTGSYYMFYITQGYGHIFRKNSIGGSASDRTGAPIVNTSSYWYVFYQTGSGSNIIPNVYDSNTIGNFNTMYTYPYYISSGAATLTNNVIGGSQIPSDSIVSVGQFYGIYTGGTGNIIINNNNIGNIRYTGGSTGYFNGIYASSYGAVNTITNNTIHDLIGNGSGTYPTTMYNSGIALYNTSAGGPVLIDRNTIYNISNIGSGFSAGIGVYYNYSPTTITRNKISNINSASSFADAIYGPYYNYNTFTVANNQISITSNGGNGIVCGLKDAAQYGGTSNYYYNNTVFMNGAANSGSTMNSYGFLRNGLSLNTADVRNNIFYNKRTGGTGNHYAVGYTNSNGSASSMINYNLMVVADTAKLVELPSSTVVGVGAFNDSYTSSPNGNWMALTSAVPAQTLFTDTATGNLSIVTTNANSWYANGKGIAIAAVTNDYNGAARSTTIAGGATDLGAIEFTTATTPPNATASAVPAIGTTTNYTFAGRKVASITWGATGTVPTSVAVQYYTGTTAPSLLASKTQFNAYYAVTPTGGTGYTYNMTLSYDSAMFGNVSSSASTRLARYKSPNWNLYSASSANGMNGMLSAGASSAATTLPANFTGTDNANPLPVEILTISASKVKDDVLVNWSTASESNVSVFEIERAFVANKFEFVGTVDAQGNSNKVVAYRFNDMGAIPQATAGVIYYRLKMIDNDGSFEYSEVVSVNITKTEDLTKVSVYPNPFEDQFTIQLPSSVNGDATVHIVDIAGRTLTTTTYAVKAGMNSIQVEETSLKAGMYFLSIELNGQKQTVKLNKH